MAFLDEMKDVLLEAAEKVSQKTGEAVNLTKTQYNIFTLKNDVKKLYKEIGELTYLAVEEKEEHTEEIQMKCDIIKSKLAKIEALQNEPAGPRYTCPNCGRNTDAESSNCPSCGADMTVDVDADVADDADGEE